MAYFGNNSITAWGQYNDNNNDLRDNRNISSVTNHATGQLTFNFSNNFSNDDYCVVGSCAGVNGANSVQLNPSTQYSGIAYNSSYQTTSGCRVTIADRGGTTRESQQINIMFIGDFTV